MKKAIKNIGKFFQMIIDFFKPKKQPIIERIEYPVYDPSDADFAIDLALFRAINQYRRENGLNELLDLSFADDLSYSHAVWLNLNMNRNNIAADFDKRGHYYAQDRFEQMRLRYPNSNCGENLAYNYIASSSLISAWDKSKTHRENMINPKFTHLGIAHIDKFFVTFYVEIPKKS